MTNIIVTLTGPSGSGKSTLERQLLNTGKFSRVISHTTREPRPGEVNGEHYHFIKEDHFSFMDMGYDYFLETAKFGGNLYGAAKDEFLRAFAEGLTPVVVVEPHGRAQIQARADSIGAKTLAVFVDGAPTTLIARIINRELQVDLAQTGLDTVVNKAAKRIHIATTTEAQWRQEAHDSFTSENPAYDLVFAHFGRDNDQAVVDTIAAAVEETKLLYKYKQAA